MPTDLNDPVAVHKLYLEHFEPVHCDWVKANGQTCRIVPYTLHKESGQRLCYVHAPMRWRNVKEEHDASTVRTGG